MWRATPSNRRAEQAGRVGPVHLRGDVVAHELQHLQLVERQLRHPLRERARARSSELVVGDALEHHAEPGRFLAVDLVAGEQVALRPLEAEARDPQPRRFRDAPDPGRRVAEPGRLRRDDQVGVEHEVGAAGDAPAVDRRDRRLADRVQRGRTSSANRPIIRRSAIESQARSRPSSVACAAVDQSRP